jgi:hypothetical protein
MYNPDTNAVMLGTAMPVPADVGINLKLLDGFTA